MPKITKETKLSELLLLPKAIAVLAKHHLPCLSCPFAESESENLKLAEICQMYGIDLKALLRDLNSIYKK